jgi:iron-sulfur cluster repair protein YtfE (RIC family)
MSPNALTVLHKYLRAELFELSTRISTAAPADAEAVRQALAELADRLRQHGEREDRGLVPLLQARAPELAAAMTRDHQRLDAQLDTLCEEANALAADGADTRAERLARLYLDWNRVVSAYLAHLDDEERTFFSQLGDALPPVEQVAQGAAASGPELGAVFLARLGGLVTPDERSRIEGAYRQLVP